MAEEKTASEKLIDNVILTLVTRGAMIAATGIYLAAGADDRATRDQQH